MRILHTEWSDGLGGQEKRILAEVIGLAEREHYVAIVCREHAKIKDEAIKHGIYVYTLPLRKPYDIVSIVNLFKFLKAEGFDIVNTHSGVDSWIGGIAAKLAKVPVLVRTRHLNIPLKRSILNFIHYLPDMYITCGENMRDNLVKQCGFPPDRVVSIPTGVDRTFFDIKRNPSAKINYRLDGTSIVITNVGILRRVKGHEITLRAVKMVIEAFPNAKFMIVGDGPRRKELEGMVDDLGIRDYVIFTGFIENISEIYSFTDVAVLSSWSEGLPQSLLQAMAAGIPVVATNVGGVPEVVISEKTGILVEPGNYEAFAKGIIRILDNPSPASRFAESARSLVSKKHSLMQMLDQIEDLYRDILIQRNR
jgi:glycosyltransferase involved in cell wall biosynthesis